MDDNVVRFPIDATIPVRSIVIEVNQKTQEALTRRIQYENLNPSTLFNRAMQVYDFLTSAQLEGKPIVIGDVTYKFR